MSTWLKKVIAQRECDPKNNYKIIFATIEIINLNISEAWK